MFTDQSAHQIRFEWGEQGLDAIGPGAGAIVVVDVLSFSTCVDIAVSRGATVIPYRWRDESAAVFAGERGAILAEGKRSRGSYSLSPSSLIEIPPGTRLVLPSPNGAAVSLRAAEMGPTFAASLRNAPAISGAIQSGTGPIAVIACGERWPDGSLRAAWEDLVGAGAVISELPGSKSPEAQVAEEAFRSAQGGLPGQLRACSSGRELIERGFGVDVDLAAEWGVSQGVPALWGEGYVAWPG